MLVYKYLEKKYLDDLRQGWLYINTFHNLSHLDKGLIGDKDEAIVHNTANLYVDAADPNHARYVTELADAGILLKGSASVALNNFQSTIRMKDAHLYCVATSRNDEHWMREEKYDTCVLIKDFVELLYRLSEPLKQLNIHEYADIRECVYEDNQGSIEEGTYRYPHYWRKTPKHKEQSEARIVMIPEGSPSILPFKLEARIDDLIEIILP